MSRQLVEILFVTSVSDDLFRILDYVPGMATFNEKGMGKKVKFASMAEIEQNLLAIAGQLVDSDHPNLCIIRREGYCEKCKKEEKKQGFAVSISNCPHIENREIVFSQKTWSISKEKLRQLAAS